MTRADNYVRLAWLFSLTLTGFVLMYGTAQNRNRIEALEQQFLTP